MLDYNIIERQVVDLLNRSKYGLLATSSKQGEVAIAHMSLCNDGLTVYTQTNSNYRKAKKIAENGQVALNIGNYNFRGEASIVGKPISSAFFVEHFSKKHPKTYEKYSHTPDQIIIKIQLVSAKIWQSINSDEEAVGMFVDFVNKSVRERW